MRYTTIIDIREFPQIYRNNNAKLVYLHLVLVSGYHDEDRDQTTISIRQICYDTGLSLSAVRHSLKVLVSAGLLSRIGITWTVKKFVLEKSISPRIKSEKKRQAVENLERERQIKDEQERREKEEKKRYQEMRKRSDPLRDSVLELMKKADDGDQEAKNTLETSLVYKQMYKSILKERQS